MKLLPNLNHQTLEDLLDFVVSNVNDFRPDELTAESIENIYDSYKRDMYVLRKAAIKQCKPKFGVDHKDPSELTEEGEARLNNRMLKRHGKKLGILYDKAVPYQDNLSHLLLPEGTTNRLRELMEYYIKLTQPQAKYKPTAS